MGENQLLILGDSIALVPKGNFDIVRYEWTSDLTLPCGDCPNLSFRPNRSGQIRLTAFDENGCAASAISNIQISKEQQVYLPNTFSPNRDGRNDYYEIFTGPSVTKINHFRIFDAEGRLMFEVKNQATSDLSLGWDGTFNGQEMLPAVFVVWVEVVLLDNKTQSYFQTMTLVK